MAQQDFFYNVLANPDFTNSDFKANNINVKNSTILDKDFYLKNKAVIEDFTDDNGVFNKNAFENAYYTALEMYNTLAENTYEEDALKSATYSYNDIFASPELRRPESAPIINNLGDPIRYDGTLYRQYTLGIEGAFVTGKTDKSIEEIAQSLKVWDGSKWVESPEEDFFANLWDTRVKATWDFDADENGNPTNDLSKIAHFKGELKLNDEGLPYYENLNGRSLVGKEVLHLTDVLTNEGSALNAIDFFDSDDLHKNPAGVLMKNLVTIAPMLIPGVNTYYIGAGVALEMSKLATTGAKLILGSDNGVLNNIEGFLTKLESSPIKSDSKSSWTLNNFINLAGDVYKQLAEQRWLFKYGTLFISKGASSEAKLAELLESTLKRLNDSSKKSLNALLDKGDIDTLTYINRLKEYEVTNSFASKKMAETSLKEWQNIGEEMARIYMTGITVADSYNLVKQLGLTDLQAAFYTIGYGLGEYMLLRTDIGKWVLPETKFDAYKINTALSKWGTAINTENMSKLAGEAAKKASAMSWIKKGWEASKLENRISPSVAFNMGKYALGNALSEGFEETTEELLADLSKTIGNALFLLTGSEKRLDAWDNWFDRYSMSFAGGILGGGLFSLSGELKTAYQAASEMSTSDAGREIMLMLRDGKKKDLVRYIKKSTWANPYLSSNFLEVRDKGVLFGARTKESNLNTTVLDILIKLLDILESVMNENGLDISKDSIIGSYIPDLKYAALMNSSQLAKYNLDFTSALNDAMQKALAYNSYVTAEGKLAADNADGDIKKNEETIKNKAKAKAELNEALEKVEKFKSGEMSRDYILAGVFELNPRLKGIFIKPNYRDWLEKKLGKNYNEITKEEFESCKPRYRDYLLGEYKDDILEANKVLIKYLTKINSQLEKILPTSTSPEAKKLNNLITNMEDSLLEGGLSGNIDLLLMLSLLEIVDPDEHKNLLDSLKSSANYEALILGLNNLARIENELSLAQSKYNAEPTEENKEALEKALETLDKTREKIERELGDKIATVKEYFRVLDEHSLSIKDYTRLLNEYSAETAISSIETLGDTDVTIIETIHRMDNLKDFDEFAESLKGITDTNKELKAVVEAYRKVLESKQKLKEAHLNLLEEINNNVLDMSNVLLLFRSVIENKEGVFDAIREIFKGGINPVTKGYYKNLFNNFNYEDYCKTLELRNVLNNEGIELDVLKILDEISMALKGDAAKKEREETEEEETPNTVSLIVTKLNLEFFNLLNNIDMVRISGDVDEAIEVIKLALATLSAYSKNPTLTNLHGYSSVYNELFSDGEVKLLEVPEGTINEYIESLEQIRAHLEYIKALSERNSNNKIRELKDTGILLNYLIYSEVERLRRIIGEDDDWVSRDLLDKALEEGKKLGEKVLNAKELEEAKKKFELHLHNFLRANIKLFDDNEKLSKIFNLNNFNFGKITKETITKNTTSLDARSFFFYLSAVAAINPNDFYFNYKSQLDKTVGPFSLLEMLLFLVTAKLSNEEVVNKFIKHYNYIIEHITTELAADELLVSDRKLGLDFIKDSTLYLKYDIATFIEGVAGAGKTTAILNMLFKLLGKDHPLFKKVLVASSSIANSLLIIDNSVLDNSKCTAYTKTSRKGHTDPILLDRISSTHKDLVVNEGDNLTLSSTAKIEVVDGVPVIKGDKVNKEPEPPTLLIIDEALLYSAFDLDIICKYCKENGTKLILLGDLLLTGISGETAFKYNGKEYNLQSELSRNLFFGGFKLGVTMRSLNKALADSVEVFRMGTEDAKRPILAAYYETGDLIKGVKVIPVDNLSGRPIDENEDDLPVEDILPLLKKMVNKDGTYTIITDRNTKEYVNESGKTVEADKLITAIVKGLGEAKVEILEGVSYSGVTRDNVIAVMSTLDRRRVYTAVSRAKEGVVLFTPSLVTNITSKPVNDAPNTGYNAKDIETVYEERKGILDSVYTSGNALSVTTSTTPETDTTPEPTPTPTPSPTPTPTPGPSPTLSPDTSSSEEEAPEEPEKPEGTTEEPVKEPDEETIVLPPSPPSTLGSEEDNPEDEIVSEDTTESEKITPELVLNASNKENLELPIMDLLPGTTNGYTFNADYIDTLDSSDVARIDGVIGLAKILGKSANDEDVIHLYQMIRTTIIYGKNAADVNRIISGYLPSEATIKSIGIKVYDTEEDKGPFYLSDLREVTDTTTEDNSIERNLVAIILVKDTMLEIPLCRAASIVTFMETHQNFASHFNFVFERSLYFKLVKEMLPVLERWKNNPPRGFNLLDILDAIALSKIFLAVNPWYYEIYSTDSSTHPIDKFFELQSKRPRAPHIISGNIGTKNNVHQYIKENSFSFFENKLLTRLDPMYFIENTTICGRYVPKGTPVIIFADGVYRKNLDTQEIIDDALSDGRDGRWEGLNVLVLNLPTISTLDYINYLITRDNKHNKYNPYVGNQLTNLRIVFSVLETWNRLGRGKSLYSGFKPDDLYKKVKDFFEQYYTFDASSNVYRKKPNYSYRDIVKALENLPWYKKLNGERYSQYHSVFLGGINLLKLVLDKDGLLQTLNLHFPNGIYLGLKGNNSDTTKNYVKLDLEKGDNKYFYRVSVPGFKEFIVPIDTSVKVVSTNLVLDLNDISDSMKADFIKGSVRVKSTNLRQYPSLDKTKYDSLVRGTSLEGQVTATSDEDFIKECSEEGLIALKGGRSITLIDTTPIGKFEFVGIGKDVIPLIPNPIKAGRIVSRVFKIKLNGSNALLFVQYNNGQPSGSGYTYEVIPLDKETLANENVKVLKDVVLELFEKFPNVNITSALFKVILVIKNNEPLDLNTIIANSTTSTDGDFANILTRFKDLMKEVGKRTKPQTQTNTETKVEIKTETETKTVELELEDDSCGLGTSKTSGTSGTNETNGTNGINFNDIKFGGDVDELFPF